MKIQYILTDYEIRAAKAKLYELRDAAMMSRDAGEMRDNREFYLRAKGFEEALKILGIIGEQK